MKNSVALDHFDLAILRILQKDNSIPQRLIGEQVNLSAPSVQRRIKRLEASGVITAQAAIIDPTCFGPALTIVVEVELKVETGGAIDLVKQSFIDAPQVQQCYCVTGEADFVLIIIVRDMSEYEALTQRLFFSNETIKKFKTFVTMDRTKVSLQIDI
ncbi:MAG: Lrp/AsnC family transcriptional regulator [Roseobacter sp.]